MEREYHDYLHKTWKRPTMKKILDKLEEKEFEWTELGVVGRAKQEELARKEVEDRFSRDATPVDILYKSLSEKCLDSMREKVRQRLSKAAEDSSKWPLSDLNVEFEKLGKPGFA